MTSLSFRYIGAAVFALSLAATLPTFAQSAGSSQPMPMQNRAGPREDQGGFERQEFREEMEQIRKEHGELEAARDQLREKCEHAAGAAVAQCEQERQELRERHERLHERMKALHEKMEAMRKERQERMEFRRSENSAPPSIGGATQPPAQPVQ